MGRACCIRLSICCLTCCCICWLCARTVPVGPGAGSAVPAAVGKAGTGAMMEPGMIFTIEPMINAGKAGIREMADGWTIVTKDHSLSAQWEHTVLVTETGHEVLTLSAGARPRPDWIT